MLESYAEFLTTCEPNVQYIHFKRIDRCFLWKGWTIDPPFGWELVLNDKRMISIKKHIPKEKKIVHSAVIPKFTPLYIGNCTNFEKKFILEKVTECLNICYQCKGAVFGGYVRDVMVPRFDDTGCDVRFKDVDLWFKTQEDANDFIKRMGSNLAKNITSMRGIDFRALECSNPADRLDFYPFTRTQYMLCSGDTSLSIVDVIVHNGDLPPVNDFDVNTLYYNGNWSNLDLLTKILKKQATMLPSYIEMLTSKDNSIKDCHSKRVTSRFLCKDWTITAPDNYELELVNKEFRNVIRIDNRKDIIDQINTVLGTLKEVVSKLN